jgi:hypothetical protein
MSAKTDWMRRSHKDLHVQANQTNSYLKAADIREKTGLGTDTPQGKWLDTIFRPALDIFNTAYDAWKNPAERTQMKTAALNDAEAVFKPLYRKLYNGFLRENPLVTDVDLVAMGFPARSSGGRKSAPDPVTAPVGEVKTPLPGVVDIHFRDAGSESRKKPAGMHGAEICWTVSDGLLTDWAQLVNSTFDTTSPLRLSFSGEKRGKTLYFALRWENTRGVKGPWSEIQSAKIP